MTKKILFLNAFLICLGFMGFSFFIHYPLPLVLLSFAGLAMPAMILSGQIHSAKDISEIFGLHIPDKIILYILIGLQLGFIYAMAYRNSIGQRLFPETLTRFALLASIIGAAEELVFRGFLQYYCKKFHVIFALLFATFSHTAYKCCLFLAPVNEFRADILFLVVYTFAGGLLFGILKELSNSILPALAAHAIFDILVYGEFMSAPWWVW